MTNWHFRLKSGGLEKSYYITGSDKDLALFQAQELFYEDCLDQGFVAMKADLVLDEQMNI